MATRDEVLRALVERYRGARRAEKARILTEFAEVIHRFGPPEIMNTGQGNQYTAFAWIDRLKRIGMRISMKGKGRCLDNIFIERL